MPRRSAREIFRNAVRSEALEEADSCRFMSGRCSTVRDIELSGFARTTQRPRLYAALHFGSPVLAYIGLRQQVEKSLLVIARELGDKNPMPGAKQQFATRKVAWVEKAAGAPFLGTSESDVLRARDHLLGGNSVYAAVDVPGNVVRRAEWMRVGGAEMLLATGILKLAAITGCDLQLALGFHRNGRIVVHGGPVVYGSTTVALGAQVMSCLQDVINRWPEEWWMWPFFVDRVQEGRDAATRYN